ncbi:MAG: hypothetical protein EOO86_17975 [Pedobacter sp.]|nr:MAG: hypothetical protein EOO86_17975 [Pedobacter sp.]
MKSKLIIFVLLISSLNIYAQSGSRKEIVSYINKILNQGVNIKFNSKENRSPMTYVKLIDRKNLVILVFSESDDPENSRGTLFQFNPAEILSFENISGIQSNPMRTIRLAFPSSSVKYSYSWRVKKKQDWLFMLTECVEIPYLWVDEMQYKNLVQAFNNLQIDYRNVKNKI